MTVSVNLQDLQSYYTNGAAHATTLSSAVESVAASHRNVSPQCLDYGPSGTYLGKAAELVTEMQRLNSYVQLVHDCVKEADRIGMSAADVAALIDRSLAQNGLDTAPVPMTFDEITLLGIPPTSGFVDDPVCAVNGNFVHGEEDLSFPGLAAILGHRRVYNSLRGQQPGFFGNGWTSVLDVRLQQDGSQYLVYLPHGGGRALSDRGGEIRSIRGDAVLRIDDVELTVTLDDDAWWRFAPGGALTGFGDTASTVAVTWAEDAVTLTELVTKRSVTHTIRDGRVIGTTANDGRRVTYTYDDSNLAAVSRPAGTMTYQYLDGLVERIVDSDGVVLVQNEYDSGGRVTGQVSQHGRRTTYSYSDEGVTRVVGDDDVTNIFVHDATGNLILMTDGSRHSAYMRYDGAGRLIARKDRAGNTVEFERDDRGRVIRRTDPDGLEHTWTFDDLGRPIKEVTRSGQVFVIGYSGESRAPQRVDAVGTGSSSFTLTELGLPSIVVDADGVTHRMSWTSDGQIERLVNPLGAEVRFEYDSAGRLVAVRNDDGASAEFQLDNGGRTVVSTSAVGTETFEYSSAGRPMSGTTVDGITWGVVRDSSGEITSLLSNGQLELDLERDNAGRATVLRTADGAELHQEYDELGRVRVVRDPNGGTIRREYDPEGRLVAVVEPTGARWHRTIDQFGRTLRATDPLGHATSFEYDKSGEISQVLNPSGSTWDWTYDTLGRPQTSSDPLGGLTTYSHSPAGRLHEIVDALGAATTMSFSDGLLASVAKEGIEQVAFEYDRFGRPLEVRADSEVLKLRRDSVGRITEATGTRLSVGRAFAGSLLSEVARGSAKSSFVNGSDGRLAEASDPAGLTALVQHNNRGFISQKQRGGVSETYEFDKCGRLSSELRHGITPMRFSRDASGRVVTVERGSLTRMDLSYDAAGRFSGARGDDGTTIRLERNSDGAVVRATTATTALDYELDPAGRLSRCFSRHGDVAYQRDAVGRVVDLHPAGGPRVSIIRDSVGAIATFVLESGTVVEAAVPLDQDRDTYGRVVRGELGQSYSYDSSGRLSEWQTTDGVLRTYRYDHEGRLIAEAVGNNEQIEFRYNPIGQLLGIYEPDGRSTQFHYDELGRRSTELSSDGSRRVYEWDALDRLIGIETTSGKETQRSSIEYDGFGRVCSIDGRRVVWDDGLSGRPIMVGDRSYLHSGIQFREVGAATDYWTDGCPANPWGTAEVEADLKLGYRGALQLGGLVFLGARVYDITSRRFLSPDPAPWRPGDPQGTDPYAYAYNDPVNYLDPTGLRPLSDAEYQAIVNTQSKGAFEKAWDAMREDPWGTLAMAGVVVVGAALAIFAAPVAAAVGVGILIASGVAAGLGLLTGTFNPRRIALTGLLGAIVPAAGMGAIAAVGLGAASGATMSVLDQLIVQDRPFNEIDWGAVAVNTVISAAAFGLVKVATGRFSAASSGGSSTANTTLQVENASFAQTTASRTFSSGGSFAGQTIDDVAASLRSGAISVKDVPIQVIVRDGKTLILNTRSALALEEAGIPRSAWSLIDMTGDAAAEARLTGQLSRNGLDSSGVDSVTVNGGGQ